MRSSFILIFALLCTISITNSLKCFSGSGVGDLEFGTESTCASGNYCVKYTTSVGGVDTHTKTCGYLIDNGITGKLINLHFRLSK